MRSGQLFWGGQRTYGGWLVAGAGLNTALVEAGLPKLAPSSSGESFPWTWTGAGAAAAAALVLLVLALRRRGITRFRAVRGTA